MVFITKGWEQARSTSSPQPENFAHRAHRGQGLLQKLFWELACQLCAEAEVLCLQQIYMLSCIIQQQRSSHKIGEFHEPEGSYQDFSTLNMPTQKESHETG